MGSKTLGQRQPKRSLLNVKSIMTCRLNIYVIVFSLLWISLVKLPAMAQCMNCPAQSICSGSGYIELTEGAVVGVGSTYVVSGNSSFTSVTMDGGNLIICGMLTLNQIVFNSGQIEVNSGALMNVTNSSVATVFGTGCTIYNSGSVTFFSSIVTGPNNTLINCTIDSHFNVMFNQLVLQGPNSQFVNYGSLTSGYIINSSNNTIQPFCLGPGSSTLCSIMINEYPDSFDASLPNACINVTNLFINSQPMTNTGNVTLCYNTGTVTILGVPNFGAATVENSCASCSIALAINDLKFEVMNYFNSAKLEWKNAVGADSVLFQVEKLTDDGKFEHLAFVSSASKGSNNGYVYIDFNVLPENVYYYRLKVQTKDKSNEYSEVKSVKIEPEKELRIYPNPTNGEKIHVVEGVQINEILSVDGTLIQFDQLGKEVLLGQSVSKGIYMVQFEFNNRRYFEKLIFTD